MKQRIKALANSFFTDVVLIRRHLHAHPELSFQEEKTADFISSELTKLAIPFSRLNNNGIVGIIKGELIGDKVIALRADMDALPVQEKNNLPFCSKNPAVMHACGHDMHMASLLGTAKILNALKSEFPGTIKLLFQPAEERIPGGAKAMIEAGVLENPYVEYVFGQHVLPDMESGKVGIKDGAFMASSDEVYITVTGKGGHAAMPWKLIDPIVIASQLINSLQQISSRYAPAQIPTVLSFGRFIADGANNVIPNEVKLEGTFRTFDEEWRKKAHQLIEKITTETVSAFGAKADIEIRNGYPALFNNQELTNRVRSYACDFLGEKQVEELDARMTAEDFSYYALQRPAVFYRLGVSSGNEKEDSPLHSPTFNPNEESLKSGMGFMAFLALNELNHA